MEETNGRSGEAASQKQRQKCPGAKNDEQMLPEVGCHRTDGGVCQFTKRKPLVALLSIPTVNGGM